MATLNGVSFVNEESFLLDLLEHVVNVYIGVNRQKIQKILLEIFKILEKKRINTTEHNSLRNKFNYAGPNITRYSRHTINFEN